MNIQHRKQFLTQSFHQHYFEIIHAFKAAIAIMIAYVIYASVPHDKIMTQWVFITIVVVMSSNSALGAQINRSMLRIGATLAGSALALIALLTPATEITLPLYLFLTTLVFIFIAIGYPKYGHMGTLGAVTFIMISLSTTPSLRTAIIRTLEILLGVLISLLVSRFIFPIRSIKLIKQRCFLNLSRITELYQAVLIDDKERFKDSNATELENKIIKSHQLQRELQAHIKYENKKDKLKVENIKLIIRSQSALYNYFSLLAVTKRIMIENGNRHSKMMLLLKAFVNELIHFIEEFIACYPHSASEKLAAIKLKSQQLTDYVNEQKLNQDASYPLYTMCFASKRIIEVCKHLDKNIHDSL